MPALATTIYLLVLACFCHLVYAQGDAPPNNETEALCHPFGTCEPCPEDALHQPYCQPFGNRRLVHCITVPKSQHRPSNAITSEDSPIQEHPEGEIPAWQACGRIPQQERADFWEFVACNVLFLVISLFVLFARSKRLQTLQARQLAARIGLVRGGTAR